MDLKVIRLNGASLLVLLLIMPLLLVRVVLFVLVVADDRLLRRRRRLIVVFPFSKETQELVTLLPFLFCCQFSFLGGKQAFVCLCSEYACFMFSSC